MIHDDKIASLVRRVKQDGEFERLATMPQLGVLSQKISSAHHTRMEYLSLCLYLTEIVAAKGGQAGTSSQIKVKDDSVSKSELVKAWFILYQFGHLFETFASERFLMSSLMKSPGLASQLKGLIQSDVIKSYLDNVLSGGQWYSLAPVLSAARFTINGWGQKERDLGECILELFLTSATASPESSEAGAYSVYQVLRDISFMHLDLQFTARSLLLDPLALALQIHEEPGLVHRLRSVLDPRGAVLRSINEYLCEEVYVTPRNAEQILAFLQTQKTGHGRKLNQSLGNELREMFEKSPKATQNDTLNYCFSLPYPCRFDSQNDLKVYRDICELRYQRFKFYPARWPSDPKYVEIFFAEKDTPSTQIRPALYKTLNYIRAAWRDDQSQMWERIDSEGSEAMVPFSRLISSLPNFLFQRMLNVNDASLHSELNERYRRNDLMPWVLCYGLGEARSAIESLANNCGVSGRGSLNHEVSCMAKFLKSDRVRKKGYYIVGRAGFKAKKDGLLPSDVKAEFDGIAFHVSASEVTMYLLEAKEGRATGNVARNEIRSKLKKLGIENLPDGVQEKSFATQDFGVLILSRTKF